MLPLQFARINLELKTMVRVTQMGNAWVTLDFVPEKNSQYITILEKQAYSVVSRSYIDA